MRDNGIFMLTERIVKCFMLCVSDRNLRGHHNNKMRIGYMFMKCGFEGE